MWIVATCVGAVFQTARTALQQRLRALLSVSGAGFVRYLYGAPLSLGAVIIALAAGAEAPTIPARFWPIVAGAGLAQILGTICLIRAFDARDYAIGTVYSKTEVIQVAVFSAILLGESLSLIGWAGVALCMLGIVALAMNGRRMHWRSLRDRAARFGLLAGGLLGLAAIGVRAATSALGDGPAVMRAIIALAAMNSIQILIHGAYLARRERGQLRLAVTTWRSSAVVGVLSVCGSACWALAFALQNAARVRVLGQIELVFTFVVARVWLGERHRRDEIAATSLVVAGIIAVMIAG